MIHGDDFISTGSDTDPQWMKKILESKFEISTTIIGPGKEDKKQAKVPNRAITYTNSGIQYEADPRHA
eukprot:6123166-Karenia_brevis.AAC.1